MSDGIFFFLNILLFLIEVPSIHFRMDCLEKSKQVQNQLRVLRSEIELLKIDDNHFDLISAEQLKSGETKYSTLKKLKSGSTKARVAFFEEL